VEKNKKIYHTEDIPRMEDELSEEELKQLEFDEKYYDGPYGSIPTWSSQYKPDK